MTIEDKSENITVVSTGGGITQVTSKVLGTTAAIIGDELKQKWAVSFQKIVDAAAAKTSDLDDGKAANLRVACEVFRHGAITETPICIEYFAGILASSRSENGEDDTAIHYLDCIKAMSSKQLHLHYAIYHSAQRLFFEKGIKPNVMRADDLSALSVWFAAKEFTDMGLTASFDLPVLHRLGLISEYRLDAHYLEGGLVLPFCMVKITTFGVMLYSAASNKLTQTKEFASVVYERNSAIGVPQRVWTDFQMLLADCVPKDDPYPRSL